MPSQRQLLEDMHSSTSRISKSRDVPFLLLTLETSYHLDQQLTLMPIATHSFLTLQPFGMPCPACDTLYSSKHSLSFKSLSVRSCTHMQLQVVSMVMSTDGSDEEERPYVEEKCKGQVAETAVPFCLHLLSGTRGALFTSFRNSLARLQHFSNKCRRPRAMFVRVSVSPA